METKYRIERAAEYPNYCTYNLVECATGRVVIEEESFGIVDACLWRINHRPETIMDEIQELVENIQ